MTAVQLRAKLAALLATDLGTYTLPAGGTTPAIWVGNPPSDYTVSGLECVIEPDPTLDTLPSHGRAASIASTYRVRLVHRSGGSTTAAARKLVSAFPLARVTQIGANLTLGITAQVLVTLPT